MPFIQLMWLTMIDSAHNFGAPMHDFGADLTLVLTVS